MSLQQRISDSTLVVVGTCTSVDSFSPRGGDPGRGLTRVGIAVENVLKGKSPDRQIDFYFYRVVGGFNGPKPNWIRVGERGVFYLVEEQGILRSVHDIWESHTKVFSGRHDIINAVGDIEGAIAEVVIVPGANGDLPTYLNSLPDSVAFLGVGARRVVPLLKELQNRNDSEIRKHACVALSSVFPWADDCLTEVVAKEGNSEIGNKARDLLQRNAQIREIDEKELTLAPAVFFSRIVYAGSREARFILEQVRERPEPIIRQRASELLRQMDAVGY